MVDAVTSGPRRRVLLGLGNPIRGDDGAGPAVVQDFRGLGLSDVEILEHNGDPMALFAKIDGEVQYDRYDKTRKRVNVLPPQ